MSGFILEELLAALQCSLRKGCKASRLVYATDLLDMLVPPADPAASKRMGERMNRAYDAERLLTEACDTYDAPASDAIKALLGLVGNHAAPLYQRRRTAGVFLGVRARTFSKNYEDDLMMDLAAELWRGEGDHQDKCG